MRKAKYFLEEITLSETEAEKKKYYYYGEGEKRAEEVKKKRCGRARKK